LKEVVVSPDHSASRTLPSYANLEQQKKQARELLRAVAAREPAAFERVRTHHPRLAGRTDDEIAGASLALHDVQLVLAREYGFPNWVALKREIESRRGERRTRVFVTDLHYYEDRVGGLVSAHQAGVPHALAQIREWHPAFADSSDSEIARAPFDADAARLVYARQHGFATWEGLVADINAVARGERVEPFREAFEAMRGQRWDRLAAVFHDHPDVLRARGTNGNSLMNLAISLAAEVCGPLPPQAWKILDVFLQSGADINQPNDRGWTPLHQAAYSNQVELARRLVESGADATLEAHGEGGTPLAVALFWGHRDVADLLAETMIAPRNLRIAAGLGRTDLVDACFETAGHLTVPAGAGRGFYRPHSGFPVWKPSGERQEILNEALVWACKSDRVEVLPLLIERGADPNADPYRGTPLLWAAARNRLAAASWLLEHGATISRATFGGQAHGQGVTPLHLAAQGDHVEMVKLLLAHDADPTVEDELYHSPASGWAAHFGARRVYQLLTGTELPSAKPPNHQSPITNHYHSS
jgi:ankyrin repeat protein